MGADRRQLQFAVPERLAEIISIVDVSRCTWQKGNQE